MATLALDDATLWYEETGDGPPLVLIHGGWSDSEAWRAQVDYFSRDHRVITYDVRGHGRTGETDRQRYSMDLFVDDLDRLLDHLDVERPLLCGLSLGSMIVQAFLARHPDRAAGAVVAGAIRSMPPIDVPGWTKPFVSPVPALGASLATVGSRATFQSLLRSIQLTTGTPWLSIDPATRSRAADTAGKIPSAEFLKIFGSLYRCDPPDLSDVSSPVIAIYGDREVGPVKRQSEQIAATVQDGTSITIPDAAHFVNHDAPEAFNSAVGSFLKRVTTGRSATSPRLTGKKRPR